MIPKLIKVFSLWLILQVFLPIHIVFADTGPIPSMEFAFNYELTGEPVTIVSGILYECDQSDCSDAFPLEELGPQRLYCEPQTCRAISYGFAPYHRLDIEFSDGITRQSNIFETAGFESKYTVTVRPEDLLIEARLSLNLFPPTVAMVIACICALTGLGGIAGLAIFLARRSKKT